MSPSDTEAAVVLFAPGAGASSASAWIQNFRQRLSTSRKVVCFDYPYRIAGRRAPDRLPVLIEAHCRAFIELQTEHPGRPIFLVGKSMGGRIGCHVSVELADAGPAGLVCLGYPLVGQNGKLRDAVLRELSAPVLFVQGTRDKLCPLATLAKVRTLMKAPNELHIVAGGDHSLVVGARQLAANGATQAHTDTEIASIIHNFLERHTMFHSGNIPAQLRKNRNG